MRLTEAQRRVLHDLAKGGSLHAALREPSDYLANNVLFSEIIGIVVHPPSGLVEDRYRVRDKTAAPLYLDGLISHSDGESGLRCFFITSAGRAALDASEREVRRE